MNSTSATQLSALQAFSTKIQSNANNIANANTPNYKKSRVTLSNSESHGVTANVERVETAGTPLGGEEGENLQETSNVELSEEIPEMNLNSTYYKANLKAMKVAEEMAGTLLDLKG